MTYTKKRYLILYVLLTSMIFLIFQKNLMRFADETLFSDFQKGSETLVVGSIVADEYGLNKKGLNLGYVFIDNPSGQLKPNNIDDSYKIFAKEAEYDNLSYFGYKSQFGIQGVFFSKIFSWFQIEKISWLHAISSFLLTAVIIGLFIVYRKIYSNRFAWTFLICTVSSPLIILFANNLYWLPFLWFLPALITSILYVTVNNRYRILLLFCLYISIFIKSLAGYEYLSTITLYATSVFIVAPYFNNGDRKPDIKSAVIIFSICIIGFLSALILHASIRGDSILDGLKNIYELDAKRRTYGNADAFAQAYRKSLESDPLSLVIRYIKDWNYPIFLWLPGSLFKLFFLISASGIIVKYFTKHPFFRRDAVCFFYLMCAPLSWFVLAKGHSYIHSFNAVLWYLGFMPGLIFVTVNSIADSAISIKHFLQKKWASKL